MGLPPASERLPGARKAAQSTSTLAKAHCRWSACSTS